MIYWQVCELAETSKSQAIEFLTSSKVYDRTVSCLVNRVKHSSSIKNKFEKIRNMGDMEKILFSIFYHDNIKSSMDFCSILLKKAKGQSSIGFFLSANSVNSLRKLFDTYKVDNIDKSFVTKLVVEIKKNFPSHEQVVKNVQIPVLKLCPSACPRCNAMCIMGKDHIGNHRAYHQPSGINGVCWSDESRNPGCLVGISCYQALVAKNVIVTTKGEVPYSKFSEYYPGWENPTEPALIDSSLPAFPRAFFSRYQKEFSEYHKKPQSRDVIGGSNFTEVKAQLARKCNCFDCKE